MIERKGDVYLLKKDYALAPDHFLQSEQMVKLDNKNLIEAPILLKIGSCYEKLNRLDSARFYYEFALNNTVNNTENLNMCQVCKYPYFLECQAI